MKLRRVTSGRGVFALLVGGWIVGSCSEDAADVAASNAVTASASVGTGGSATAAGTGGSTATAGGQGGSIMIGSTCAAFGDVAAECLQSCAFADPVSAAVALGTACQVGMDALSTEAASAVGACLDCATQASCAVPFGFDATAGTPYFDLDVTPECATVCDATSHFAENDLSDWLAAMPHSMKSAITCTNGWKPLIYTGCDAYGGNAGGGMPEECAICCCDDSPGCLCTDPTITVAASCTGNGPVTCTCTAGSNTGAMFQLGTNCGGVGDAMIHAGVFPDTSSLWDFCNL